jgi:hypothetical protein
MMFPRLSASPRALEARDNRSFTVKGRLRSGVSMAQAQAELNGFARNLERSYPNTNKNQNMVVRTELQTRIDSDPIDGSTLSAMLLTMSLGVLLVTCINMASCLPAAPPARAKEMALRLAIGPGRSIAHPSTITESPLIALTGGLFGVRVG